MTPIVRNADQKALVAISLEVCLENAWICMQMCDTLWITMCSCRR